MKLKVLALVFIGLPFTVSAAEPKQWKYKALGTSGDSAASISSLDGLANIGIRCFSKNESCVYILNSPDKCEDTDDFPLLGMGPNGTAHITGSCYNTDGTTGQMILSEFDAVEKLINHPGGIFGVAVPMESGVFKAYRFSLNGASEAIKSAVNITLKKGADIKSKDGITF